jgi:hypothetical protein
MNVTSSDTAPARMDLVIACVCALAVALVAISTQSLWIDEGGTAYKALQPTLGGWWSALRWEHNSNMQLPLYLLYSWAWTKIFGISEFALRAANIPPFLICIAGLKYIFSRSRRLFLWSVLFLLTSPFVWFYLNEARPYILLLASSTLVVGSICRVVLDADIAERPPARWFQILAYSALAMTATSALAALWTAVSLLAAWHCIGRKFPRVFFQSAPIAFVLLLIGHLFLVTYYLWAMRIGSQIPHFGNRPLFALFHIAYEMMGFAGFGPGRLILRGAGVETLRPFALPLAMLLGCWLSLFALAHRELSAALRDRLRVVTFGILLVAPLIAFAIGLIQHVRISPRYLTPVFPMFLCLATLAADIAWRRALKGRAIITLLLCLSITSALELRFALRHTKEDYRSAASLAKEAVRQHIKICWAADVQTAIYYRVIEESERDTGSNDVVLYQNPSRDPDCEIVILSREDVYDSSGNLRRFVRDRGFKPSEIFQGFQVYRR